MASFATQVSNGAVDNKISYATIPTILEVPNLIRVQLDSFERFKSEFLKELFEEISPIEAGLKFFVKLDKGEFTGRDALAQQVEVLGVDGIARKLDAAQCGQGVERGEVADKVVVEIEHAQQLERAQWIEGADLVVVEVELG